MWKGEDSNPIHLTNDAKSSRPVLQEISADADRVRMNLTTISPPLQILQQVGRKGYIDNDILDGRIWCRRGIHFDYSHETNDAFRAVNESLHMEHSHILRLRVPRQALK